MSAVMVNGGSDLYLQFRDTCGCFPNLVRNYRWTIVTDQHSWNVRTQNAFSLPFAAILVNCAPSGEMHNYSTPHIIKDNFENFLIHRCNYILLSQVYCVWQVVKTLTIILNNPVLENKKKFCLAMRYLFSKLTCKWLGYCLNFSTCFMKSYYWNIIR